MWVGALKVQLFISDSDSLKSKRAVVAAIKDRLRNSFNVSVAEVDDHDAWQKAVIGIASVGADKTVLRGALDKMLDLIRSNGRAQVIGYEMDIF